jgi:hypothetical protein
VAFSEFATVLSKMAKDRGFVEDTHQEGFGLGFGQVQYLNTAVPHVQRCGAEDEAGRQPGRAAEEERGAMRFSRERKR